MNRRLPRFVAIALLATVCAVAAAAPASARAGATLSGTIQTTSPASRILTIRSADGTKVTLNVTRATAIVRNSARAPLPRLAPGDQITARYNAANQNAARLIATGPAFRTSRGQVMDVNRAQQRITLATDSGVHTFKVSARTLLVRNNRLAPLSSITLFDAVTVHGTMSRAAAAATDDGSVDNGEVNDVEADGPDEQGVDGTISKLSGSDVTITPSDGGAAITVHADSVTVITLDGKKAKLSDLAVGMRAQSHYDPVTMAAFSIEAETVASEDLQVSGTVSAVDTNKGTISITPDGGGAVITLTVDASTEIAVADENAKLGDVKVGAAVKAKYTAALLALEIHVGGGGEKDN